MLTCTTRGSIFVRSLAVGSFLAVRRGGFKLVDEGGPRRVQPSGGTEDSWCLFMISGAGGDIFDATYPGFSIAMESWLGVLRRNSCALRSKSGDVNPDGVTPTSSLEDESVKKNYNIVRLDSAILIRFSTHAVFDSVLPITHCEHSDAYLSSHRVWRE